jgi:hypothetical protein
MNYHLYTYYISDLFKITNAAITPGTHPTIVRINTIRTDPQPLSNTASGGKIIERSTLPNDIFLLFIHLLNYKDN